MVKVDNLDEWFNFASFSNLLLTHSLCDFQRVTFYSGHNGMRIWSLLCTFVPVLDDNCLLAGLSSLKQQDYFSTFQEFWHFLLILLCGDFVRCAQFKQRPFNMSPYIYDPAPPPPVLKPLQNANQEI